MMNYVWAALIFLGIAAALSSDIIDGTTDKYQTGKSLNAVVYYDTIQGLYGKNIETKIKITKEDFNKFYNENIPGDIEFGAQLNVESKSNKSPLYILVEKSHPELLNRMAKVNGKEDDLSGELQIIQVKEGNFAEARILFEKISFIKMKEVTNSALSYADTAVKIALGLIGIMAMWLGIMKIADEAGLIRILARALTPVTRFLFPDVPSDHPAMGAIIMNWSANFLGLSNAATPFGLKAMEELNTLNDKKDTATNAMCTFLALNTGGMTMIPATAIALRAAAGSAEPAIIIGTSIFGSTCATIVGVLSAKLLEKFPMGSSGFANWIKQNGKFFLIIAFIILFFVIAFATGLFALVGQLFSFVNAESVKLVVQVVATMAIPLIITVFVLYGFLKKVKVYEVFIEGAKEGFNVAIRIIPYLVGILMAIAIFRAGGAMDWLIYVLKPFTDLIGFPAESLPMALMRPLSGSGSLGVMAETMAVHGTDSFIGILTSTLFGSSETTFYVVAVYFGSVSITKVRHALAVGLMADLAGTLGALLIVRMLFG
ncbi:MAG: nucleoside recognition domain-containing protein [Ignavibacteriaceae bacterium]